MIAPRRGEIYFVNLNPVQGREQAGQRPVLVLSINAINQLPLVVTVVVGTKGEHVARDYPTNVRVNPEESGLSLQTVFLCFQLRSLDVNRFPERAAGRLSAAALERVERAVRYCLGL
jgi:mRNA interferase MazF